MFTACITVVGTTAGIDPFFNLAKGCFGSLLHI
jgi:hypothetical protein